MLLQRLFEFSKNEEKIKKRIMEILAKVTGRQIYLIQNDMDIRRNSIPSITPEKLSAL